MVSIPIIIIYPVMVIDATEYNSGEMLPVLSKRQVAAAIRWLCAAWQSKRKGIGANT